jgi:hypothetical protein
MKDSPTRLGCFLGGSPGRTQLQSGAQSLLPELLARLGAAADPTHAQVEALWPAMVYDGGYDYADPAHQGSWKGRPDQSPPGLNAHTFVGSRGASVDAAFDSLGADINGVGYPTMNNFPTK